MRAVKDSLPAPSEEDKESEGPRWTAQWKIIQPPSLINNEQAWKENPINDDGRLGK